jgi:hypothetical protein
MRRPALIVVGEVGQVVDRIEQRIEVLGEHEKKFGGGGGWLTLLGAN